MKRNSLPLNIDRDHITPSYLRALRVAVRAALLVRKNNLEQERRERLRRPKIAGAKDESFSAAGFLAGVQDFRKSSSFLSFTGPILCEISL